MRYRLIALDLDDTLLNAEFGISQRNINAIREAARRGVMVTIATGRMFRTSLPYARELALNTDWPMINYHGALIKTIAGREVIDHRPMPNELAVSIAGEAEARGLHVNAFVDDRLFIEAENEFSRYYQSIADIEPSAVGKLAPFLAGTGEDPTKLTLINWDGDLEETEAYFKQNYAERIVALQSRSYFLEITDRHATKGQALRRLAERQGIEREEIIAIGDSFNDIDMIEYAGLGVAVANARPEVRRVADLVTATNLDDGVARVIEQYILAPGRI